MKVALYTQYVEPPMQHHLQNLKEALQGEGMEMVEFTTKMPQESFDFVLSIGGDGTLLSCVHHIVDSDIPVVGVNFGHLGFLTTIGTEHLKEFAHDLKEGNYTIERRTLLNVKVEDLDTFALNEVFVHRAENVPLLKTDLYVEDELVATYSGDGLIVATPTGSTAYSLSCGGPILTPNCGCFVITPIGAHSLTLRPFIVPDTAHVRLITDPRHSTLYLGTDSRSQALKGGTEITLQRANFTINLVRMSGQSFFSAIHQKLLWGTDARR